MREHFNCGLRKGGRKVGDTKLSALWAVSGDCIVPALFLLPIPDLLQGDGGGGEGKVALKTLAN